MTPDLSHPYGLRAWLRIRLPWWAINIGIANKGKDCVGRNAPHHWYNIDDESSGCCYCIVTCIGKLWQAPVASFHEYDTVRISHLASQAGQHTEVVDGQRCPQVGDKGTIVSLLGENGPAIVESVAPDGRTLWLTTLDLAEIELISCSHAG